MTKEESAQKALVEATDMKFTTAYSKGWDDAVEKAYEWIYDNYADVYNEEIYDCKFDEGWRKAFKKEMEE